MTKDLGPCKLIWYQTNKQLAFEFMADEVMLIIDTVEDEVRFDPGLVKQILGREPTPGDMAMHFNHATAMTLDCEFKNPDYGKQIAKRVIKRLRKNWGPKQMLLVPNYGLATTAQSMVFWRSLPFLVTHKQFLFHILPTDEGERTRRGL